LSEFGAKNEKSAHHFREFCADSTHFLSRFFNSKNASVTASCTTVFATLVAYTCLVLFSV